MGGGHPRPYDRFIGDCRRFNVLWGDGRLNAALHRTVVVLMWIAVVALGLALSVQRFRDALDSEIGTDLGIFVSAAGHVREGESPLLEPRYVYSPLLAAVLVPFRSLDEAMGPWAAISIAACWGAVAAVVATYWGRLSSWQRPVLAGVALFSVLYSYVLADELWLGQVDTIVLLFTAIAVLLGSRGHQASSGMTLIVGAVLKTWPIGLAAWSLRRGVPHRARLFAGMLAAGVTALALVLIAFGPKFFSDWVERTLSLSEQPLVAYSAWGAGRDLFAESPQIDLITPLLAAPMLGTAVSVILAGWVIVLAIVVLRRPGDDSLSMWNLAGALLLLIPVSHLNYQLLMLPLLWVWIAHVMTCPRRTAAILALCSMGFYWFVVFRSQPLETRTSDATLQYLAIIVTTLVALTISVWAAAALDSARRRDVTDERHRSEKALHPKPPLI